MARRRRKRVLPRIRFKKKFPFISFGGAVKNCQQRLKSADHHLMRAIEQADSRGYTGFVSGRGGAFDDPRVKAIMRKRDALLEKCTHIAVKRKGKWEYR